MVIVILAQCKLMSRTILVAIYGHINYRVRITVISMVKSTLAYLFNALRDSDLFKLLAACKGIFSNVFHAVFYVNFLKAFSPNKRALVYFLYTGGNSYLLYGLISAVYEIKKIVSYLGNCFSVYLTRYYEFLRAACVSGYSDCTVFILFIGIIFRGVGYGIIDYNKCREIIIVSYLIIFVSSVSIVARDIRYAEIVLISLFQQFAV